MTLKKNETRAIKINTGLEDMLCGKWLKRPFLDCILKRLRNYLFWCLRLQEEEAADNK